ncbi:type II 3-dehydroquinate dehydratase [Pseudomonas sp. 21LCFQ02]|uniref:type II 3-dehydroquinate dehydratase n=1 Tax=Pseudomonas sp. 21LCFQ02 TaxID=2957505 RepID=UPI00209A94ED|nr:type II 3-dehydroquinate dehydratase [Pseudomonas sp. 21LCFQ02]MCO8167501.1 type II 3-dehydroquinate dehydratase [Pseudomonas sp. 21LCFQ02]
MSRRKILVVQGANMSRLGKRSPELYGRTTAAELDQLLYEYAEKIDYDIEIFYTHVEGEAIARIYEAVDSGVDGLIMNPAGFVYSGFALRDCIRDSTLPYIEVHIRNSAGRGTKSATAEVSRAYVCGFGVDSYILALEGIRRILDVPRA